MDEFFHKLMNLLKIFLIVQRESGLPHHFGKNQLSPKMHADSAAPGKWARLAVLQCTMQFHDDAAKEKNRLRQGWRQAVSKEVMLLRCA